MSAVPSRITWAFWVTLLIAAAYLVAVNDQWAITRDSALYLGLGRSLAEGHGMEFDGRQWWGIPPLAPMLIAGCRLIVGDHFWLINLVMTGLALGAIYVTYLLARLLGDDLPESWRDGLPTATVLVVGLSARLFIDATHIMTDVPFLFFSLLGLYGMIRAVRHHWGWAGLGTASLCLATSARLLGVLFVVAAGLMLLLHLRERGVGRRPAAALALLCLPVATTAAWFFLVRPHQNEGTIDYVSPLSVEASAAVNGDKLAEIGQSLTRVPEAMCGALVGQKMPRFGVNLAPTALIVVGVVVLAWRRKFDLLVFCVPYLAFLVVYTPGAVAARYFLPVMPLLAYFLLVGTQAVAMPLVSRLGLIRRQARWRFAGLVVLAGLCLAISLPRVGRQIYWMRHPDFYAVFDRGDWQDYVQCSQYIRGRQPGSQARVLSTESPVVLYLTGLNAPEKLCRREIVEEPPEAFLGLAADPACRFVLAPDCYHAWSEAVTAGLAASGRYDLPPRQFGSVAVYERRTSTDATH